VQSEIELIIALWYAGFRGESSRWSEAARGLLRGSCFSSPSADAHGRSRYNRAQQSNHTT